MKFEIIFGAFLALLGVTGSLGFNLPQVEYMSKGCECTKLSKCELIQAAMQISEVLKQFHSHFHKYTLDRVAEKTNSTHIRDIIHNLDMSHIQSVTRNFIFYILCGTGVLNVPQDPYICCPGNVETMTYQINLLEDNNNHKYLKFVSDLEFKEFSNENTKQKVKRDNPTPLNNTGVKNDSPWSNPLNNKGKTYAAYNEDPVDHID